MRAILQAVEYIHQKGIVHRDLKPGKTLHFDHLENILIGESEDLRSIKIADFGLSAKYDHVSFRTLDQHCGTLIFMAPEVALHKEYSKSVDVWSTGIVMYMLLTGGKHPLFDFQNDGSESYKKKLSKLSQLSCPQQFSELARKLFLKLTKFNSA